MSTEAFIERKFHVKSLEIIQAAEQIIDDYQAQGFTLTLRQLYYQFVSRDLLENNQHNYKRLGSIINDARLAGLLDWAAIEDRTRNVVKPSVWDDPSHILSAVAAQYQEDAWATQPRRIEIWIEKDALVGVLEPVCGRYRLPLLACRGYLSQSEQYAAGKRFERQRRQGQRPLVLHLGDHDPSGMDMTRDNRDRLQMFARMGVELKRLALNWDQIEQYAPPPNFAKETDSRSGPYIDEFGESSWELDALEPTVIDELVDEAVKTEIDQAAWDEAIAAETENRATLTAISNHFEAVQEWLMGRGEE